MRLRPFARAYGVKAELVEAMGCAVVGGLEKNIGVFRIKRACVV